MKLLELLLQELPKRGGWPEGTLKCCQSKADSELYFHKENESEIAFEFYPSCKTRVTDGLKKGHYHYVTREQYEAAIKPPEWIDWEGGKCPVENGTLVDVKYRDGKILCRIPANKPHPGVRDAQASFWCNNARENDIVAYRLSESEKRDGEGLPPVGTKVSFLYGTHGWIGGTIAAYDGNTAIVRHNDGYAGCSRSEIQTKADRNREQVGLALYHAINWNAEGELAGPPRMEDYRKAYDAIAAHKITGVTTVPSVGEIMRATESCSREDAQKIVDLLNGA